VPFSNLVQVTGIAASGWRDFQPFIRLDGMELWFVSDRPGGGGGSTDIWRAPGSGATFTNPVPVTELNTPSIEFLPYLTPDGLTVYWTTQRSDPAAQGMGDIWTAHRASMASPFVDLHPVTEVSTPYDDHMGSLSTDDGCRMFLDNNSAGSYDIYVSVKPPLP
jgi:hypothetical protein